MVKQPFLVITWECNLLWMYNSMQRNDCVWNYSDMVVWHLLTFSNVVGAKALSVTFLNDWVSLDWTEQDNGTFMNTSTSIAKVLWLLYIVHPESCWTKDTSSVLWHLAVVSQWNQMIVCTIIITGLYILWEILIFCQVLCTTWIGELAQLGWENGWWVNMYAAIFCVPVIYVEMVLHIKLQVVKQWMLGISHAQYS